jgi:hypothetical protein
MVFDLQAVLEFKMLRPQTALCLLPGVAADVITALQGDSATQQKAWGVSNTFSIQSFVTGGNFLFAPVSRSVLLSCCKVLEDIKSQMVRLDSITIFSYRPVPVLFDLYPLHRLSTMPVPSDELNTESEQCEVWSCIRQHTN